MMKKNLSIPAAVYEMALELSKSNNASGAEKWLSKLVEDQYRSKR